MRDRHARHPRDPRASWNTLYEGVLWLMGEVGGVSFEVDELTWLDEVFGNLERLQRSIDELIAEEA